MSAVPPPNMRTVVVCIDLKRPWCSVEWRTRCLNHGPPAELIAVPDPVPLAGSYQEYPRRCEQRRRVLDRVPQARVCAQFALNTQCRCQRDRGGWNALCWGGRCDRRANRWASGLRPDRVVRRFRTWRAVSHRRGGHGSANGRLHRCRHGRIPAYQATGRACAIGPKSLRRRVSPPFRYCPKRSPTSGQLTNLLVSGARASGTARSRQLLCRSNSQLGRRPLRPTPTLERRSRLGTP